MHDSMLTQICAHLRTPVGTRAFIHARHAAPGAQCASHSAHRNTQMTARSAKVAPHHAARRNDCVAHCAADCAEFGRSTTQL
eukprot:10755588-Alexandrium_andersonii.AAC.1